MKLKQRRCSDNHDTFPLWIMICGNLDCGVNILADEYEGGRYVARLERVATVARGLLLAQGSVEAGYDHMELQEAEAHMIEALKELEE